MRISDWSADVCSSDLFFVGPNDGMPHVKSGRLKVLATATNKRLTTLPDLPTLMEEGYDVAFQVWLSRVVAAGAPTGAGDRSEGRRVGQECVRTCGNRWPTDQ